jgi:hypothetical protein
MAPWHGRVERGTLTACWLVPVLASRSLVPGCGHAVKFLEACHALMRLRLAVAQARTGYKRTRGIRARRRRGRSSSSSWTNASSSLTARR